MLLLDTAFSLRVAVGFGDFEPESWGSLSDSQRFAAEFFTVFWALLGIGACNIVFSQIESLWSGLIVFQENNEESGVEEKDVEMIVVGDTSDAATVSGGKGDNSETGVALSEPMPTDI